MRVVEVGSHVAKVPFGGAEVPLGFLASFRKKSHLPCESGRGFLTRKVPGQGEEKKMYVVCPCSTPRAAKKLRQVGAQGFQALGDEWLAEERKRVAADEERCRQQGREAAPGAACPYPKDTDQAIAWEEGRSSPVS